MLRLGSGAQAAVLDHHRMRHNCPSLLTHVNTAGPQALAERVCFDTDGVPMCSALAAPGSPKNLPMGHEEQYFPDLYSAETPHPAAAAAAADAAAFYPSIHLSFAEPVQSYPNVHL